MELMTWSDGKLEERLERIDKDVDRVDERLVEVNSRIAETAMEMNRRFDDVDRKIGKMADAEETNRRFDEVDRRIREGREEARQRFDRIEGDISELRAKLDRITIGLVLGFPAVIATILAKGG